MSAGVATTESITRADGLPSLRLQPARALEALRKLHENPQDIAQGFVIVDSLAGDYPRRVLTRFRKDPVGRKLLAERPKLLTSLSDRRSLERMPRGSLAHAYLAFLEHGGISADGLIQASAAGRAATIDVEGDFLFVRDRIRDSHDLWHAVTGHPSDVVGEVALLAFNVAQLRNPGIAVLVLGALARHRELAFSKVITRAFVEGLRASWLPPVRWESMLPLPLDEVRAILRVEPAPLRMSA